MRPNILYIHSHDTGRYVQPYGYAVPTPAIQALAKEGVLFREAFNAAPTCSPSRAALLTGQVPHSCGQFGLVNRGFELRDREKHLANTLSRAGYYAASVGVHHVVRDPLTCGYDRVLPVDGDRRDDRAIARAAASFLSNPPQEPFFLAVGFVSTHREFEFPGAQEDAHYCRPPAPIPDTPETREDMSAYMASARLMDECMGHVFTALKVNGLADSTLVICTTDHGLAFPYMKCNLTDHGTGVMLIMRGPGGFAGGRVVDALVSQLDLYPTVCELAGVEAGHALQGSSLVPLVREETDAIRTEVNAQINFHCTYEPMRSVRTKRWKYIRRYASYGHPMPSNIDESPSKALFMAHGYAQRNVAPEELYDLVYDPHEASNLATDPGSSEALGHMRERLARWMRDTKDPLLDGPVAVPPGAFVAEPTDETPFDLWDRHERPEGYA